MLKLVLKNKVIIILFILFIAILNNFSYSNNIIYNYNESPGPIVLKNSGIVVTGDSFAGKFCEFELNKDLKIIGYARAGCTIDQNKIIMAEALNFDERNVLISIGVNDQYMETPPYRFEYIMRSLLNISVFNKKIVYLHSYLKYFADTYSKKRFSAIEYDLIIRRLCSEYYNTFYIDVKDLESPMYISDDLIHYNSLFYDELYNRLINAMQMVDNIDN